MKTAENADTIGENCSVICVYSLSGYVTVDAFLKNMIMTASSKETTKANIIPEMIPRFIHGSVTL